MGVVWGPNPVAHQGSGRLDEGVICIADNAYNAALVTCGVMTNDERLTAEAKAKLSNASSGGSFYTLASAFKCFLGEDGYVYPDWVSNAYGLIEGFSYMYGNSAVWWARYESNLLASAKEDLQTVLNGGSLGCGSGSGGSDDTGTSTLPYVWQTNSSYVNGSRENYGSFNFISTTDEKYTFAIKNTGYNIMPTSYKIFFTNNIFDDYTYENRDAYLVISNANSSTNNTSWNWTINIYLFNKGDVNLTYQEYTIGDITNTVPNKLIALKDGKCEFYSFIVNATHVYFSNTDFHVNMIGSVSKRNITFTSGQLIVNKSAYKGILGSIFLAENDGGNVLPPSNWPETEPTTPKTKPVVPDPPEVTAPTVPTYDPKSYTNPVITTGTGDTYNSTTTNIYNFDYSTSDASGQDVIPYLQAILAALNNITRNVATYMLKVQNLINDVIEANDNNASQVVAKLTSIITAINNAATTVNGGIGELDTDINTGLGEIYELIGDFQGAVHNEFKSLKSYLKSLFQWLADQFDFTFDGGDYDDSSILYWLRRIYYKLGAGRVNTRPTDPVADPVGIGDWLAQLFRNFLGGLLGIGGEALDAVLDALDDLRNKFPFSIPWDLAAILGLLVADPVAPNFDVPQYTITTEGLQQVATYHIDLSVFDDVMVGVRTMETLVFAFCLAFKTDFFKGLLTVHGGE